MKRDLFKKKLPAFNLTELLVVLVIIGILVLLALPNLMPLISKAKSTEAKLQLSHVYTLDNLEEIGFEQEKLVTEEGQANYIIEIVEASSAGFKAIATAVADFDGDGTFNVWEIDQDKKLVETVKD